MISLETLGKRLRLFYVFYDIC